MLINTPKGRKMPGLVSDDDTYRMWYENLQWWVRHVGQRFLAWKIAHGLSDDFPCLPSSNGEDVMALRDWYAGEYVPWLLKNKSGLCRFFQEGAMDDSTD